MTGEDESSTSTEILKALLRIDHQYQDQLKAMQRDIKSLEAAITDQALLNTRLLGLLEKTENDTSGGSELNATPDPSKRYFEHPQVPWYDKATGRMKQRYAGFSWDLFAKVLKMHRIKFGLPSLTDEEVNMRKKHVRSIYPGIVLHFKQKYQLTDLPWSHDLVKAHHREMFQAAERDVGSYYPLRLCIGHWGARVLLSKHWQNIQQSNSRKKNSGTTNIDETAADNDDEKNTCTAFDSEDEDTEGGETDQVSDSEQEEEISDHIHASDDEEVSASSNDSEGEVAEEHRIDDYEDEELEDTEGECHDDLEDDDDECDDNESDDSVEKGLSKARPIKEFPYRKLDPLLQQVVDKEEEAKKVL